MAPTSAAVSMTTRAVICGLLLCGFIRFAAASPSPLRFNGNGNTDLQKLYEKISSLQTLKEKPYRAFRQWHEAQGVYKSEVMLNFHGGPEFMEFRRLFGVFDNNMFATALVTSNLLEAYVNFPGPKPTETQLNLALGAMSKHRDMNAPTNSSIRVFWPQVYNETIKYWRTAPDNLLSLFEMVDSLPFGAVEAILKKLGFGDLAETIEGFLEEKNNFIQAFRVPSDFDDTFINLRLGALLYGSREYFPSVFSKWRESNGNLETAITSMKDFAYRPFSKDRDVNTIDPRTYYYVRGFLDQAEASGQDIALVTTWVQSIKEARKLYANGNPMPFNVNNVDVTVSANAVSGLTSALLSGLVDKNILDDPEIAQVYLNTSSLLAYEVTNNFTSRPELALTYYPSIMEAYWFIAKTLNAMESALKKGPLPSPMDKVFIMLNDVCFNAMTKDILSKAKSKVQGQIFFDDFLGNGDTDLFDKPVKNYEDRIFTTAMAANALLYTWTYNTSQGTVYRSDTPENVKAVINGTINWLTEYTLSGTFKPWNAFFSGSVKGFSCLPFWYPGNRFEFLNGTAIKDWSRLPSAPYFYGVEGYIPKEKYEAMLKEKHFGFDTPKEFLGYNTKDDVFPFWSSEAYTYSSVLVAMSTYRSIKEE